MGYSQDSHPQVSDPQQEEYHNHKGPPQGVGVQALHWAPHPRGPELGR